MPSTENISTRTPTPWNPLVYRRRLTRVVMIGDVGVGGTHPLRIQSMTTSPTMDTEATVNQVLRLAEVGCEIARITAPTINEARNLEAIKSRLLQLKCPIPLVADIHFRPDAAMVAADFVEKVRVNPGNFVDGKAFKIRDYTDDEYNAELRRIEDKFTPLVLKLKKGGRALRIGTNHGSLSDRIMNRFGDTPLGMVESALEFVRICEANEYYNIVVSMKASNPRVMIAAYRMLAARMAWEGMNYPFHLGVTEAGDGEDGRIKSAVGIGSLLEDGIGDTIRVSLTEDPEFEIPVARALAARTDAFTAEPHTSASCDSVGSFDPFSPSRRTTSRVAIGPIVMGGNSPLRVASTARLGKDSFSTIFGLLEARLKKDTPPEILIIPYEPGKFPQMYDSFRLALMKETNRLGLVVAFDAQRIPEKLPQADAYLIEATHDVASVDIERVSREKPLILIASSPKILKRLRQAVSPGAVVILGVRGESVHAARAAVDGADPWILCASPALSPLSQAAVFGSLICDGQGDLLWSEPGDVSPTQLDFSYNLLQATGSRITKTEYVSCPSCGRTLFDLQSTTERIKSKTNHLKGVKIAIMGCIVNGPGEMADADFGYVGGGPGKINLYVGKDCVEKSIPTELADQKLIDLIKANGKWVDPQ